MAGGIPPLRNPIEKKRRFPMWAFITVMLFFLGVLVLLFLRSPFSTIQKITIDGNQLVLMERIIERIPFSKGESFFSIDVKKTKENLSTLPEIKDVQVKRVFPNEVYISVKEKKTIGLISSDYLLYPVFEDGVVVKKSYFHLDTYNKPLLDGWQLSDDMIHPLARNLAALPQNLIHEIDRIRPIEENSDKVQLVTKRKHHVIVRADELSKKMEVYPFFLNHPPGKLYLLESIWFKPDKYS